VLYLELNIAVKNVTNTKHNYFFVLTHINSLYLLGSTYDIKLSSLTTLIEVDDIYLFLLTLCEMLCTVHGAFYKGLPSRSSPHNSFGLFPSHSAFTHCPRRAKCSLQHNLL